MKWQGEPDSACTWRELLASALPALGALPSGLEWALGGGTALMLWLNHRVSKDIDIFFESAKALRLLAPSINPLTRGICDDYQQPGHYIKLIRFERGEIDFLVSRTFEDEPVKPYVFEHSGVSRPIMIETPREIVSKKVFHRASEFTIRDIFDVAAVAMKRPSDVAGLSIDAVEKMPLAIDRVKRLGDEYRANIRRYIMPLNVDEAIFTDAPDIVAEAFGKELERR